MPKINSILAWAAVVLVAVGCAGICWELACIVAGAMIYVDAVRSGEEKPR